MTSIVSYELGTKENPHPILPKKTTDRIPGHYYINKKGELRYWNGTSIRNKEYSKKWYEENKEKVAEREKKWYEENKEKSSRKG